ncbi:MAG: hypothetical protein ACR2OX_05185 [Methyloligellaceae bacterium]
MAGRLGWKHFTALLVVIIFVASFGPSADAFRTEDRRSVAACQLAWNKYLKAKAVFKNVAANYWRQIANKKKARRKKRRRKNPLTTKDYVLKQPPSYKGPATPKCKNRRAAPVTKKKKIKRRRIAVAADFLRAAKKKYNFKPLRVDERKFMRRYAREALRVGFTSGQIVGVYALETGGVGPYSRQSGIFVTNKDCKPIRPKGKAASTALGYAQLLAANTAVVAAANGNAFAKRLDKRAARSSSDRAKRLRAKASTLRRMLKDIHAFVGRPSSKGGWAKYVAYGKTPKGFAVHALNLDADIGPMLQVYKLLKIKKVAERHKQPVPISAARLELMNLVGYGRGLEMLTPVAKDVPTANFFSEKGYRANPVAKNKTSDGLLQRLGSIIRRNLKKCGSVQFLAAFKHVAAGQ